MADPFSFKYIFYIHINISIYVGLKMTNYQQKWNYNLINQKKNINPFTLIKNTLISDTLWPQWLFSLVICWLYVF